MSKKNRMNRGLDALFSDNFTPAEKEESREEAKPEAFQRSSEKDKSADGKARVKMVNISLLEPNKEQPRTEFDPSKMAELISSIAENGLLQPILVTPLENGGYKIVAGERRWRAARAAYLKEVPVYIRELDDFQVMQLALIENLHREDLSPIEEARAYKKFMETHNLKQEEVAISVGKSRSAVANLLRLLELPEDVAKLISDGRLSNGHAKVIMGLKTEKEQFDAAQFCVENQLTVRQLEEYVKITHMRGDPTKRLLDKLTPSVKVKNPFLREFEVSVKDSSSIKASAREMGKGATVVTLTVGKDTDSKEFLSKLADFLTKY